LADVVERSLRRIGITVSRQVLGIVAIIFGVLIIIYPPLLSYLIAIFLIIEGILLLTDYLEKRHQHTTTTANMSSPQPPAPTSPPSPPSNKPQTPIEKENL